MNRSYPVSSLFNTRKLRSLLSFGVKGYLAEIGWIESFKKKAPVDRDGSPLPWVTYSFIDFIRERLNPELFLFEFGSGNSTMFYASRTKMIVSVEHDRDWYEKVRKEMPENSELIFCELQRGGDYCKMAVKLETGFDLIIVDGRDRVNCCKQSIHALNQTGVLVLDDSERPEYAEAVDFMKQQGFKHLSFSGISPGFFYRKATSLFYREGNCLGV